MCAAIFLVPPTWDRLDPGLWEMANTFNQSTYSISTASPGAAYYRSHERQYQQKNIENSCCSTGILKTFYIRTTCDYYIKMINDNTTHFSNLHERLS
jgi:hypothetical protein